MERRTYRTHICLGLIVLLALPAQLISQSTDSQQKSEGLTSSIWGGIGFDADHSTYFDIGLRLGFIGFLFKTDGHHESPDGTVLDYEFPFSSGYTREYFTTQTIGVYGVIGHNLGIRNFWFYGILGTKESPGQDIFKKSTATGWYYPDGKVTGDDILDYGGGIQVHLGKGVMIYASYTRHYFIAFGIGVWAGGDGLPL